MSSNIYLREIKYVHPNTYTLIVIASLVVIKRMNKQIVECPCNRIPLNTKGTNYWYMLLIWWILKPLSWVKEPRCKGIQSVCFYSYENLERQPRLEWKKSR